ncbi:hypothetical protein LTR78_005362 [Recurvomyces mirabilis]|uniref:Uncharacterized protein n=1 Tax=Recurvomyces mirabilis TaxID=574656 RepID=A0AAE0WMX6_9PEZI|nr:hypothetical protein LTR78_005362 [Recurvomyces mirabilis]KAK5152731.1 hypothetical protein LTS14_008265 [Recurvomyces mirabilis]
MSTIEKPKTRLLLAQRDPPQHSRNQERRSLRSQADASDRERYFADHGFPVPGAHGRAHTTPFPIPEDPFVSATSSHRNNYTTHMQTRNSTIDTHPGPNALITNMRIARNNAIRQIMSSAYTLHYELDPNHRPFTSSPSGTSRPNPWSASTHYWKNWKRNWIGSLHYSLK